MRVLVLTGAGVSAESGIPTFRGKGGYWRNLDPAKLATPEAFARDPELVWQWFGEQLPWSEAQRIENFLSRGACDVVIVVGTTATFGYIIDWALRASASRGVVGRALLCTPFWEEQRAQECAPYQLIEVNPEETPLSQFATRLVRDPAAVALPRLIDEL